MPTTRQEVTMTTYTPPLTVTPGVCHCGKFAPGHVPGLTARYATCTGDVPDTDADRAVAQAAQQLAGTPTAALLRAAYALTHRIHEAERVQRSAGLPPLRDRADDLRAQRDRIDAEVLRRTGDL